MSHRILDNASIVTEQSFSIRKQGRMPSSVVNLIESSVTERSAKGIAAAIARLVSSGVIPVETRLPTVREVARRLGVSPTTVSEAWRSLAAVGAIEARGRLGTYVRHPTGPGGPRRYRRVTEGPGHFALDLSTGTPDPALLPDLRPAIASISSSVLTSSYLDHPVLPALEEALRDRWPFEPEEMTVVDGAMDALDRIAQVVVRLGDRVVVEHPTFPPLLDLLELLGADVIGVDLDDDGMSVDGLRDALTLEPVAVFLQPRAHNPSGISMTAARATALAAVLRDSATVVIEDDTWSEIGAGELQSIGAHLPSQTVHSRSFSKSHGPDLRLAAVGGAGDVVVAAANRRLLGPGWSSRILQAVLLGMLDDKEIIGAIEGAADEYARRRRLVTDVLGERSVPFLGTEGINLWMRVVDERSALLTLAARGIGAAPGDPFQVRHDAPHLRLTVGLLNGSDAEIVATAELLAAAAGFTPARAGQR
jgi:DNA-binding transcriptional MocR family regulator